MAAGRQIDLSESVASMKKKQEQLEQAHERCAACKYYIADGTKAIEKMACKLNMFADYETLIRNWCGDWTRKEDEENKK